MANRRLARRIVLCLALAAPVYAAPPTSVIIGTPPQPTWSQLTPQQKSALAPLVKDWDNMENVRRKKWLGIAERYPTMKPEEQVRMREWARLTPEQRAKVRDTYKDFNQLPPEQKQTVKQKWEAYSSLSEEEKQRARESGKSSRLLAPPPAHSATDISSAPAASEATPLQQ